MPYSAASLLTAAHGISCQIMPRLALTDISVRNLKPGIYFDTRTPAFGIRIGSKTRTWLVLKGARSNKVRLGHYPSLSLADARNRALVALGSPLAPPSAPRFPEARTEFLAQGRWRPRSLYQITRTLNRHFKWTKPVNQITHQDVSTAIAAIKAPSEAAHAFKDIRTFFNWCVPNYIQHSPCAGLKTPSKYVPRDRLLTDAEIVKIWKASLKLGGYGLQVRRLIVTGQRANQIFSLVPEWLDTKTKTIEFPADIMKGNRPHAFPYGKLAASLLSEFPRLTNQCKFKWKLEEACGFDDFTHHDFRRYFSSTHAKLRTPIDVTEALLSHVSGSRSQIQRIYDRWDRLPLMRKAQEAYEAHLTRLFE